MDILQQIKETEKKLKLLQLVKAKNQAFERMNEAQKRVAIAQDVIQQLEAKRLTAKHGVYVEMFGSKIKGRQGVMEAHAEATRCEVCGIGALFVATCDRRNAYNIEDGNEAGNLSQEEIHQYLSDFFPKSQLRLIEGAFETMGLSVEQATEEDYYDSPSHKASKVFGAKVKGGPDVKLIAIMTNIIKNHGTFDPTEEPELPKRKRRIKNVAKNRPS